MLHAHTNRLQVELALLQRPKTGNKAACIGDKSLSDLGDIVQHRHASHFLLNGPVVVDLVPELGSVGCVIHLRKKGGGSPSNLHYSNR